MKNNNKIKFILGILVCLSMLFTACDEDRTPSIYPGRDKLPIEGTPVISSVSPADSAIAGITLVTIKGENFSTVPENNIVYFGSEPGKIVSSTANEIKVVAPNAPKDSLTIQISVRGAELFNESPYNYKLVPPSGNAFPFKDFEVPYGIAFKNNVIYFSLQFDNKAYGIFQFTRGEELYQTYAPKGPETFFKNMVIGPDDLLYVARATTYALFRVEPNSSSRELLVKSSSKDSKFYDVEFDKKHYLWGAGQGGIILRADISTKEKREYLFDHEIAAIRVFNDYLYAAVNDLNERAIWRFPITVDNDLGTPEKYCVINDSNFDLGYSLSAIEISSDGVILVGTNNKIDPILKIDLNKSQEIFYPGKIPGPVKNLRWGVGDLVFYSLAPVSETEEGKDPVLVQGPSINFIHTGMNGSPRYGRQ